MAGEAVLSVFMQVLFDKLYTTAVDELRTLRGVNEELESLAGTLSMIQGLLEDAEEKQMNDKPVRIWLTKLKEVAYEMDELLDNYEAQNLRSELEGRDRAESHKRLTKVSGYISTALRKGFYHYKTAHKIKAICKKLEKISEERKNLGLQVLGNTDQLVIAEQPRPQTSSLVDDLNVFGREADKEKIIERLMKPSEISLLTNFSVLPIVGMGGLGKTTLTQLVYNDRRVKLHFDLRMWICISENFDEIKLTKETLQSAITGNISAAHSGYHSAASGRLAATTNMNLLQEELCDSLKGKRFLLVLDDVWNENPQKWERFCVSLRAAVRGSRIIITTQNANVGLAMGALPPYRLKQLSDEDCWNMFRNCAFVDGDPSGHPNLEEIGKEIVKKLQGLPLAAKTLGSLLYSKLDEEDWKNILSSEIWELPSNKNNILPALRLSYKHLPPHLKQCFTFCSVFHKDYVFQKDKLVQMWMALGYIQPQGRRRLEDIGNSYFDDMLSRSFFQPYKGNFVMHDAIHDLAQSISASECRRLEDNTENGSSNVKECYPSTRHMSYSCHNSGSTSFETFLGLKKLRTLLLRGYKSQTPRVPNGLFLQLKCLRVLDLYRRDITVLPDSVGNLIQLRFLGLAGTAVETLPSSISQLYNLQTLKLKHCNLLDEIPQGVTNLINLRHLEGSTRLVSKIAGIGKLTHLQELEEFIVREESGCSIRELKEMSELRGKLCIQNLEYVKSSKEAKEANLYYKEHLSVLQLIWTDDQYASLQAKYQHEAVLEGLKPHCLLKELTIKGYGGVKFPSWLWSPSFCYLETIHLSSCQECQMLPSLGQLPFLKYLDIGDFGVIQIGQEFSGEGEIKGFPSLKGLVVEDMPDLELWLSTDKDRLFPCLVELEITECLKLRSLPQLPPTLQQLRVSEVGLTELPEILFPDPATESSLSLLQIHKCPNLKSLQQGLLGQQLSVLEKLVITRCEELATLPLECFQNLVNLRSLHIYNCPKLAMEDSCYKLLPSSIQDLQLSSCSNLIGPIFTELQTLTSLTNLKISCCSGFYCFPIEKLPPSVKSLGLIGCPNLQCLRNEQREPTSLETLIISNCPGIASLPVEGLQMLQELHIQECPLLKACFQDGNLHDEIAHIPRVEVDGERIKSEQSNRRVIRLLHG